MTLRLQIFIGIIMLVLLMFIISMVRKKKIDLKYALGWIVLDCVLIIIDIFPQIIFGVAALIGIEVPSNMLFFLGFILALCLIYSGTVSISFLSMKIKQLTQELALLRDEMERMKKND